MDIKKLTEETILKNMTPEQQKAVLESVMASVKESKQVRSQKIAENVDLVMQALKKIEAQMLARLNKAADTVETVAKNVKDGKDGRDGKDGKDGKGLVGPKGADGRNGKDGKDGKDGRDGVDGVSVVNAFLDFDNSLVIELSNGKQINVGGMLSDDAAEKVRVVANGGGTSQGVLDAIAALQTAIATLIPSQTGNAGKFLTTDGSTTSWASVGGGLSYQGTWNASTNSPTLTSSVGTNGYYYVVGTAGSTNLNGVTDWQVGDWAIFSGTTWQKIDQTNLVTSVAGRTGAVTLSTSDISGLGTIATQNANNVAVTGGAIDGTTIGGTVPAAGTFTTLKVNGTGGATGLTLGQDTGGGTNSARIFLDSSAGVAAILNAGGNAIGFTTAATIGAGTGSTQMRVAHTASAVNYVQVTGAATTVAPQIVSAGSDTNVGFSVSSKGTGTMSFYTNSVNANSRHLDILHTGSVVNRFQLTGAIAGGGVTLGVNGSDTNISQVFQPKGTGAIDLAAGSSGVNISNGGTVTAITRTSGGSGYATAPTVTISPPTTAGGVQATATCTITGGVVDSTFTITNAGSGYVEQPTVSFSGGGGSGAAAYATVGSATILKTIGSSLQFYTPAGLQVNVSDSGATAANYLQMQGRATGNGPIVSSQGSDSNVPLTYMTKGTSAHNFSTNASTTNVQMAVAHTASAVNYVQVTGAATGNDPTISAQGSDSTRGLIFNSKGAGGYRFCATGSQFNVFTVSPSGSTTYNYFNMTAVSAGSAPALQALGSDTNIDLALTPKGTGVVQFGSYTATGSSTFSIAGYITIKDSSGTLRNLAVIA